MSIYNDTQWVIGMTTCASPAEAERIAENLVSKKLAACVQIIPGVQSVYEWQGAVEKSSELLLYIKTAADKTGSLTEWIENNHSYDTPEILFVPITSLSSEYKKWMSSVLDINEE